MEMLVRDWLKPIYAAMWHKRSISLYRQIIMQWEWQKQCLRPGIAYAPDFWGQSLANHWRELIIGKSISQSAAAALPAPQNLIAQSSPPLLFILIALPIQILNSCLLFQTEINYSTTFLYLIIDLDVNLVPLSVAANQRGGFMRRFHCDWLLPKVGQDWRRGQLVDIIVFIVSINGKSSNTSTSSFPI